MEAKIKSSPSESLIADRFRWLEAAYGAFTSGGAKEYLSNQPPVDLLLSGLKETDPERWNIGVIDAQPASSPSDEGPSAVFTYEKPEERRTSDEASSTIRQFDPPSVLVQQLHILFGGRLRLRTSRSHVENKDHPKGVPYHYPLIGIPTAPSKRLEFRALRAILDAPSHKLATGHEQFHDLRRHNLQAPWLTQQQAADRYGAQKGGRYHTRNDAIKASMYAFDLKHSHIGGPLKREEFHEALTRTYQLLDCHPLKPRKPINGL
jgi:hypothetical protein